MTDFCNLPLSDTEMLLRNRDAYHKADRAIALMDSIECGPAGRSCDLDAPCPGHGGDRREDEYWTAEDEAALVIFEQRFGAEVTCTAPKAEDRTPAESCDPDCHDRATCSLAGTIGHQDCGLRSCGCPKHHVCVHAMIEKFDEATKLAEYWRGQANVHLTSAQIHANTIARQKVEYGRSLDAANAQIRQLHARIKELESKFVNGAATSPEGCSHGHGVCLRCRQPWCIEEAHVTQHMEFEGCFPLCKRCWAALTPQERLPFYDVLIEQWDTRGVWLPTSDATKAAIHSAVLEGK